MVDELCPQTLLKYSSIWIVGDAELHHPDPPSDVTVEIIFQQENPFFGADFQNAVVREQFERPLNSYGSNAEPAAQTGLGWQFVTPFQPGALDEAHQLPANRFCTIFLAVFHV